MQNSNQSIIKNLFAAGVVFTALMLAISAFGWCYLPAGSEIPAHWNASGEVDRYTSKFEGLLLMPLVSAGLFALFMLIAKIEPRLQNLKHPQIIVKDQKDSSRASSPSNQNPCPFPV